MTINVFFSCFFIAIVKSKKGSEGVCVCAREALDIFDVIGVSIFFEKRKKFDDHWAVFEEITSSIKLEL